MLVKSPRVELCASGRSSAVFFLLGFHSSPAQCAPGAPHGHAHAPLSFTHHADSFCASPGRGRTWWEFGVSAPPRLETADRSVPSRAGGDHRLCQEIELLCDQAWGSMLEVPAGSRFNVSGLGYFSCFSYSVLQNNNYYFFLRMDENYNIVPHGVNFQDPIFPDTAENHRMFSSFFQFSNCTPGTQVHSFSPEWEVQEDSRLLCSTVQKALFEEEERVRTLSLKVRSLEKANDHLREKVRTMKRQLRQAQRENTKEQQTISLKQLYQSKMPQTHPDQDTTHDRKNQPLKKKLKN